MPFDDRKKIMKQIEGQRRGRTLVAMCNFDRRSSPELPGLAMDFHADLKESLYRVLKESPMDKGLDVFLYTRGGDTNSVWPIACLLREFDPDFEVLVPFRAHSAGTMLALAAKRIVMTRLAELSPIDPTTGNQFNPVDPIDKSKRMGISVEDMRAYQDFIEDTFCLAHANGGTGQPTPADQALLQPFVQKLADDVHPLALGNVHRVHELVSRLAKKLMAFHAPSGRDLERVVKKLTVETYSHLHMIGRDEAKQILGTRVVRKASVRLEAHLDLLLRAYEDDFGLRGPLYGARFMGSKDTEREFRFIGGALESRHWGYLYETKGKMTQHSVLPERVQVQLPPGQPMPLVPGAPRAIHVEIDEQRWHRNTQPEGVTV